MILRRHGVFYLSCLAAFTAGHMVNYAVIIYAQEVIRSDLLAGLGFGLCFGPPLLLGWYAGVLCDRHAPGRVIHGAQALFIAAAALLWAGHAWIDAPAARVPTLLLAALLAGGGWSFVSPARMAALGQIATAQDLKPASVAFNLFVMLGFGLGPLMLALARSAWGWPGVFGVAAGLFLMSSAILWRIPTHPGHRRHAPVLQEIGEGLAAVRARPLLAQLLVAAMAGYLAMGPMSVLLPKLAATQLGLAELQRGAFLGTLALSLIAGGLLALVLGARVHHGRAVFVATVIAGLGLMALGATHQPILAVMWLCLVGAAGGLALSLIVAGIQVQAPAALRGRIVSMYTIVSQVVPAASGVAAGLLVQAYGVDMALRVCGATLVLAMLANTIWMRALRTYRG